MNQKSVLKWSGAFAFVIGSTLIVDESSGREPRGIIESCHSAATMNCGSHQYKRSCILAWSLAGTPLIRSQDPLESLTEEESRVRQLFTTFRSGEYRGSAFPELEWKDIPALLKMAESKRELTCFPRNPLSSQYVEESLEGVVALWLVEGLRRNGEFPSLNALCLDKRAEARGDFESQSRASHGRIIMLYAQWWKANSMRGEKDAKKDNPLESTAYHWY